MEKIKYERPIIRSISVGVPNKIGSKGFSRPMTHIEGIAVKDLIEKYGSPLFVISEKVLTDTFNDAKRAFTTRYPKVQFAWSYKTNYIDAVCRIYQKLGSWAEVVSGFEYHKALKNGIDPTNIIFNGPDKSKADLELAIRNGSYLHIDHFDELFEIVGLTNKLNLKAKVAVRINMDTGIIPQWDRFGFNYESGEAWNVVNRIMLNPNLELVGLHCHIGTYILSTNAYGQAASKLAEMTYQIEKKFKHNIKYIDIGGGFASKNTLRGAYLTGTDTCPTFDEYADAISNALINTGLNPKHLPTLILETGRALIDDAAFLLGTVLANKRLPDGRRSTIVDVGVNILFTAFWYDHTIIPAQDYSSFNEDTIIYGPLCMNIDIIRPNLAFPPLNRGDNFVILRVGAYNMTQWMQFITLRPKVILIDTTGHVHIIRENETEATFAQMERLPEYLK